MIARRIGSALAGLAVVGLVALAARGGGEASAGSLPMPTPIRHVVIIYQENHSFDNVLGALCAHDGRCDGATQGRLLNGKTIPLRRATDVIPDVNHETQGQLDAIDGGHMDGFEKLHGCTPARGYACYSQFAPGQIPNLATLARRFAVSDRTFAMDSVPTWGAHLELVAQKLDGFYGTHGELGSKGELGPGWGCDSGYDAPWSPAPGADRIQVPACVPDYSLDPKRFPYGGAYRKTPVQHVPTIMSRLDDAGLSWHLYASEGDGATPYGFAICPTFAECRYTDEHSNQVPTIQVIDDARAGELPSFSAVLPYNSASQHNDYSMRKGDDWIGSVVSAIEQGPDWSSTAIFITYDDCGCFYDHVAPPPGLGIRLPMVIVSPYARPAFTDSHTASFSSLMAFTEHVLDVAPLTRRDAMAYDYLDAFDFGQTPLAPVRLHSTTVSGREREHIRTHPPDPDDPT